MVKALLTLALALGVLGQSAFYTHILFNQHARFLPFIVAIALGFIVYHWVLRHALKDDKNDSVPADAWIGWAALAGLALILGWQASFFPLGGWDAWSCWNLKAKFIYLGQEHWKDMLDPMFWRSNTHYPLLLPLINVWFWDLIGHAAGIVPQLLSVGVTLLAAALVIFTLARFTKTILPWAVLVAAVFSIPFVMMLAISQYSDILVGLYLLCAFICLLLSEYPLCGLFLGLLSFTKTEGTVAAGLMVVLIVWQGRKNWRALLPAFIVPFLIAALPTLLFQIFYAPKNEAFINGLISAAKPSTWERLKVIAVFTGIELISVKWCGLWIAAVIVLAVRWKKSFTARIGMMPLYVFAIFIAGYLAVALAYYHINTFFDILWWMQNTLNRILFALIPSLLLWVGLSLTDV